MGWLDKLLGRDKESAPSLDDSTPSTTAEASDMQGGMEDAAEDMSHGDEPSADEAGEHGRDEL
jgi:hypothetical protein